MARKSKFKITRFENPSGDLVFRVAGSVDGKQIRKNFKLRKDAVAFRDQQNVKLANGTTEGRFLWVKMTPAQHDDAWTALQLLANSKSRGSVTEAVQYYLKHYRPPEVDVPLGEAVSLYLNAREKELFANTLSQAQFTSIRTHLRRLAKSYGDRAAADIRSKDLEEFLSLGNNSPKTWNNGRSYLHTFFAYCLKKRFVAANPAADLAVRKIKRNRGTADTLTSAEAAELMRYVEGYSGHVYADGRTAGALGCFVPFFALALFAGIRPDWQNGEISKLRGVDVNLDTNTIHIEPEASKNDEKRSIHIQPNLRKWLQAYPLEQYPILPVQNMERSLREIRKAKNLSHDVLRHTFISMHVGKFRSVGDAALEAGNSEAIIRKHYLGVVSKAEAETFWKISPGRPLQETS